MGKILDRSGRPIERPRLQERLRLISTRWKTWIVSFTALTTATAFFLGNVKTIQEFFGKKPNAGVQINRAEAILEELSPVLRDYCVIASSVALTQSPSNEKLAQLEKSRNNIEREKGRFSSLLVRYFGHPARNLFDDKIGSRVEELSNLLGRLRSETEQTQTEVLLTELEYYCYRLDWMMLGQIERGEIGDSRTDRQLEHSGIDHLSTANRRKPNEFLSDLLATKDDGTFLVHFYADWCSICMKDSRLLAERIAEISLERQDFKVVSFLAHLEASPTQSVVRERERLNWTILALPDEFEQHISAVPQYFLVKIANGNLTEMRVTPSNLTLDTITNFENF